MATDQLQLIQHPLYGFHRIDVVDVLSRLHGYIHWRIHPKSDIITTPENDLIPCCAHNPLANPCTCIQEYAYPVLKPMVVMFPDMDLPQQIWNHSIHSQDFDISSQRGNQVSMERLNHPAYRRYVRILRSLVIQELRGRDLPIQDIIPVRSARAIHYETGGNQLLHTHGPHIITTVLCGSDIDDPVFVTPDFPRVWVDRYGELRIIDGLTPHGVLPCSGVRRVLVQDFIIVRKEY